MREQDIPRIDLAVINLYPFEAVTADADCALEDAIENIDIGGPAMVRSAAKNFDAVGVVTSPDQYESVLAELEAGDGPVPEPTDLVKVRFRGTLVDGKVFDSSYKRGQSISFPLNRVIAGWTEGLQLMKEGAKYELVIPAKLGYGPKGAGGVIPPDATLVFEVELLKVH